MKKTIMIKTNGISTPKGRTKISFKSAKDVDGEKRLTPAEAEVLLCGTRLKITITEGGEQGNLPGIEPRTATALADVKSFTSAGNWITSSLSFTEDEMDIDTIKQFRHGDAMLEMEVMGPSEDQDGDEDEDEGEGE